jgi:3-oxoacyl-[acyl-carrier protein] reductase
MEGRVALVLGGSGGLGRAVSVGLAAEGVTVAVAGRSADKVAETVAAVEDRGGRALPSVWDLADLESGQAAVEAVEQALGSIDILVNITGGPPPGPVTGFPPGVWQSSFGAMVLPVIALTNRVTPGMVERGWGRVVTCTSSGVVAPIGGLGLSNALRQSLVGWSKTLATELAPHGVTCNVVVPGRIDTGRVAFLDRAKAERTGSTPEEVSARSRAEIPVGRYGRTEEFANVVTFLASEAASYVTGASVRVDGGLIPSV